MGLFSAVICILLVIAALVGICLLDIKGRRDFPVKNYDERQLQAINEAYRVCFIVGFVYYAGIGTYFLPMEQGETLPVSPSLLVHFGIYIQLAVLHIHNLLTHSAMPLSGKPKNDIISWTISGCIFVYGFYMMSKRYPDLPLRGEGTIKWVFLMGAAMSFLRVAGHVIALLWNGKEEE